MGRVTDHWSLSVSSSEIDWGSTAFSLPSWFRRRTVVTLFSDVRRDPAVNAHIDTFRLACIPLFGHPTARGALTEQLAGFPRHALCLKALTILAFSGGPWPPGSEVTLQHLLSGAGARLDAVEHLTFQVCILLSFSCLLACHEIL